MSWGIQVADGLSITKETATSTSSSTPMNPLGAVVKLDDGRAYKYVRFDQAAAVGQLLTYHFGIVDADVDAAASDNTMTGTGDFTANAYQYGQSWVHTNANTGTGQNRRVKANTANVLTLESAWTVALSATTDYIVHGGAFCVELTDAACECVAGVALSAMTINTYGWMQVAGLAFVRAVGSTDAMVENEGIVASATEGAAKGFTAGGTTADEAAAVFAVSCVAVAAADAAGQLYPCILKGVVGS